MNASLKPTILVPANYGDPFEGGFYGGRIASHDSQKIFGIVWAPKAEGQTIGIYAPDYSDIIGARSFFHSMDNTRAMANARSDLAKWALNLRIGGHDDWCLPARDVLELGYRNLKPGMRKNYATFRDGDNPSSLPAGYPYSEDLPAQTIAAAFQTGGDEAFDEAWYHASTQYSSHYAWSQDFRYGGQDLRNKKFEARARAVRLIQLNP